MDYNLLTYKEAADYLGVHWQTIRNYVISKTVPAIKIGRTIRVRKSDLDALQGNNAYQKQEIELRFLLSDREAVEAKLRSLGAKISGHSHIVDHYFVPSHISNLEEQHRWYEGVGGFALRVREVNNDYSARVLSSVEVKKPIHGSHSNLMTSEMITPSYAESKSLLELMSYIEFLKIDKERLIYRMGNFLYCFDTITGWGDGLEIEIVGHHEYEKARKLIMKSAAVLGLGKQQLVDTSFTRLAMPKLAKFK